MCGIAGMVRFDGEPVARRLIERMTDLISHRGPDDSGIHVEGPVGLGHRRLAIIDLSPNGHQPMSDPERRHFIVYNGECYNYRDFLAPLAARGYSFRSTSDTEPLLYLYAEHGPRFVEQMQGMFAFALWDAPRKRLVLARDRLGIKPLYYYADSRHVVFASELKALLADPALPSELDDEALADFLHLMSVAGPAAVFRGVRHVQPGHYVMIEDGRVEERPYWDVPMLARPRDIDLAGAAREFEDRFRDAVTSHMISDVPVGGFLSGGIDSSAVVSLMADASPKKIDTFAVTFPELEEFDEARFARLAAERVGVEHHEIELTPRLMEDLPKIAWHADEPFAISSSIGLFALSRLASRSVKVVLTGDGGDEVFGGYVWRHAPPSRTPRFSIRREARRRMSRTLGRIFRHLPEIGNLPDAWRRGLPQRLLERPTTGAPGYVRACSIYQDEDLEELLVPERASAIRQAWAHNVLAQSYERYPSASEVARRLYTDIKTTLVGEMLTKVDRMTMAFGLEARVPFLDHRLVEWAFSLPDEVKVVPGEGKRLIRRAMRGRLPDALLARPKHGFNVPLRLWLKSETRQLVSDLLSEDSIRRRGLFRPSAVEQIVRDHDRGVRDRSNQIYILLLTELWFREYVDGRHRFVGR